MIIISVCIFALMYELRILLEILADGWLTIPAWAYTAGNVAIYVTAGFVLLFSLVSLFSGKRYLQAVAGALFLLFVSGLHTAFGLTICPIMKGWQLWSYVAAGAMAVIAVLLFLASLAWGKKARRRTSSTHRRSSSRRRRRTTSPRKAS